MRMASRPSSNLNASCPKRAPFRLSCHPLAGASSPSPDHTQELPARHLFFMRTDTHKILVEARSSLSRPMAMVAEGYWTVCKTPLRDNNAGYTLGDLREVIPWRGQRGQSELSAG